MAEQGLILDMDTKFLERLKMADQSIGSMIHNADKLTESLKRMFNSVDGSNIDLISRIASQWEAISRQKLSLSVNTSSIEKLTSKIDGIVQAMQDMSSNDIELFDSRGIYDTTRSLAEVNASFTEIEFTIDELKKKYVDLLMTEVPADFFPTADKFGIFPSVGSDEYNAQVEAFRAKKSYAIEEQMAVLIERRAIEKEQLKWANMTQDERAEYVKKKLNEILKEERAHNNEVIAEYRKTINEMLGIMRETDRLRKKNEGGTVDLEIEQLNARFAQLNQERIAMEQNYGSIIVSVAEAAHAKAVKIYADRKITEERLRKEAEEKEWQAFLSSPEGALQLASDAKTIDEMKEAQKYLQIARGAVDSTKDRKLIDELNNAYTRLRITIEDLTTAEKNEHSLQPSIRNEYIRLLRELEKVQNARERLSETESFMNADPQTYSSYNDLLRREVDIQNKLNSIRENSIVESEGRRIDLLEEVDRAYLAERAQREVSETERVEREKLEKIRARYKELSEELRQLQQGLDRIDDLERKYEGDIDLSVNRQKNIDRTTEVMAELIAIKTDHESKISDIEEAEGRKRLKDEVDRAERAARLSIEVRKKAEEAEEKYRGTYRGAMEYSKNTKSIQEQIQAIKYLKQARESLNRTDFSSEKEYRKALNELTLEIDRQADSIKELNLESKKTNPISGQLKTAITNMVGIGAIKGYVSQLIRIRGEFELQNKSLQVLLRNKDEANRLWEQTVELAVKSPYRVEQLVTATKQLAAYRVETEKLHSTTRMLADLSSGLGVEIDRLILAFGQVKAANFLRGTELRQFSEAGINILDELAARYTELEGRIVSVGDVFDRVSKRMVSFADVEAVLQGMTGEGGQFYKMQEQQAETLRGMTMNLKDSIMLMYNDIGEATDGVLKGTLAFFKYIVDNWKSYANIIATVVGALVGYKTTMLTINILTSRFNPLAYLAAAAFVKMGSTAEWATSRMRMLSRILKTIQKHPIVAIITALTTLIGVVTGLSASFEDGGDSAKSHLQILDENAIAAKNAAAGIKELTDERNKLLKVENRSEEQEKRLNDITSARTRLLGELTAANAEYAKSLKLAGDNSEGMAKAIEEQNAKIESQLALAYSLSKIDWEKVGTAQKSQDTKEGAIAMFKSVYDELDFTSMLTKLPHGEYGALNSRYQKLVMDLRDINGDLSKLSEESVEYILTYNKRIEQALGDSGLSSILIDYVDSINEVADILPEVNEGISLSVTAFAGSDYGKMIAEGLGSKLNETKNDAIKKLQDYWKYVFANESVTESAQKSFIGQITKVFNLEEGWFTKQISKELSAWQNGYNALLDALTNGRKIPSLMPVDATTSIKDQVRLLKEFKEEQEAIIKQYDDQQKYKVMLPIHSEEDAANAKKNLDVVQQLLEALGQFAESNKTDTRYTNLIKTVNDVYSAFDRLEEKFGDTIATEMLWRDYAESIDTAFRRVGKSANWVREQFGDLNSKESLKSALDWIAENASTEEARLQAKTASAKITVDLEIETRDKEFDKLTKQVEDMFSGYELAIELDKLHVPKEFAKDFFNIGTIDIAELRKKIADLKPQFDDKGAEKEYQAFLDKLDEIEVKSQQERLKKYVEFTRDAISERGKILLEEVYTLADIDSAFTLTDTLAKNKGLISEEQLDILRAASKTVDDLLSMNLEDLKELFTVDGVVAISDEQIANLTKYGELLAEQRMLAIEHAKEQTEQETAELDWSLFKESEVFAQVFNDLENASDSLISTALEKLKEFKSVWADMDVEEFSEVLSMIDKLEAELALATPSEVLKTAKSDLKDAMRGTGDFAIKFSDSNKAAEDFSPGSAISPGDYNAYREALETELAIRENVVNTRAQELAIAEREYNLTIQNAKATDDEKKAAKDAVDNAKNVLEIAKGNRDQVAKTLTLDQQRRDALDGIRGRMEKSVELANDLYGAFKGLAEVFFEEDSIGMVFADMGMQMMNTVMNTIMLQIQLQSATAGAMAFGTALNTAMGVIGWIVMSIQLLTMALTAAFKAHDKNIQNQIDAEVKKVNDLKKAYEALEKQLEKAFTASDMGHITREMTKNLEKQIDHTEKMIALEEDKKKSDQDAINGWKDDIQDMEDTIEELYEETFSTVTDGILDDVIDASRNFVDAWYDAFRETGDGMKGLKDTFKEMLLDMLKQQATMNVMSKWGAMYKDWLKEYVNPETGDEEFTKEEAEEYAERVKATFPDVNEELEGYLAAMMEIADQFETGELSGLQKGIQGITEDQAEVLASYWNSCRYLLANVDTTLTDIATRVLGDTNGPNSIIGELKRQTDILRDIYSTLESVVATGGNSTHGGAYIKVFDM